MDIIKTERLLLKKLQFENYSELFKMQELIASSLDKPGQPED